MERLLSAYDLAEVLNCKVQFIWLCSRRGEIPYLKIGKYNRYRLSDVMEALSNKDNG